LMVAFEVENGKHREFRTGSIVSISLFKTGRIELLNVKVWYRCSREEGLSLVALLLQGKEVMVCFADDGGRPAVVLSK
jgi:hypothetical protein